MDCIKHSGTAASSYCQQCGKGYCADCTAAGMLRSWGNGLIVCESCIAAWQSAPQPFGGVFRKGPNPTAAGVLGLVPGVGAMYNGQFVKGLIHALVFAVLCSMSSYYAIFGFFIAVWVVYQAFEAFHTARAMRDGDPVPDPLGLNELAESINRTMRPQADYSPYTGGQAVPPAAPQQAQTANPGEWQSPYAPPMPDAAQYPASAPGSWQRREPIAAAVLIGLGVLMLLGQLHFLYARVFQFVWPVLLIAAGVWLILRNTRDSQGGSR